MEVAVVGAEFRAAHGGAAFLRKGEVGVLEAEWFQDRYLEDESATVGRVFGVLGVSTERIGALDKGSGLGSLDVLDGPFVNIQNHAYGANDADDRKCFAEATGEISHGVISLVSLLRYKDSK